MEICPVIEIYKSYLFNNLKYKASIPNFMFWFWAQFSIEDSNYYFPQINDINFNDHVQIFENEFHYDHDIAITKVKELSIQLNENILKYKAYLNEKKNKKFTYDISLKFESETSYNIEYSDKKKTISYKISKTIFNQLKKNYTHDSKYFLKLCWCLIHRHKIMGIYNDGMQISVNPKIIDCIDKFYKVKGELFSSVFNCYKNVHGSIFYDIERYFNSIGSFFKSFDKSYLDTGWWIVNPPFVLTIIEKIPEQIDQYFEFNHNKKIGFVVILPVWDHSGQEELCKYANNNPRYNPGEYKDIESIKKLKNSKFYKDHMIVTQEAMVYYNYFKDIYLNNVSASYIFLLSNEAYNLEVKDSIIKLLGTIKNKVIDVYEPYSEPNVYNSGYSHPSNIALQ